MNNIREIDIDDESGYDSDIDYNFDYPEYEIDRDDEDQHSNPEDTKINKIKGNARLKLYKRYLPKIFEQGWNFNFDGNNAIVTKTN